MCKNLLKNIVLEEDFDAENIYEDYALLYFHGSGNSGIINCEQNDFRCGDSDGIKEVKLFVSQYKSFRKMNFVAVVFKQQNSENYLVKILKNRYNECLEIDVHDNIDEYLKGLLRAQIKSYNASFTEYEIEQREGTKTLSVGFAKNIRRELKPVRTDEELIAMHSSLEFLKERKEKLEFVGVEEESTTALIEVLLKDYENFKEDEEERKG